MFGYPMTQTHKGSKSEILIISFVCRWQVFQNPVTYCVVSWLIMSYQDASGIYSYACQQIGHLQSYRNLHTIMAKMNYSYVSIYGHISIKNEALQLTYELLLRNSLNSILYYSVCIEIIIMQYIIVRLQNTGIYGIYNPKALHA